MKTLTTITDPVFVKPGHYNSLDRFFLKLIRDERDLPFVHLTLRISLTMIPLGILLYLPFIQGWAWWLVAAGYAWLNNFAFKGPFGLMLHCTSHRTLYKKEYQFLNYYLPWVVPNWPSKDTKTVFPALKENA